MRPLSISIPERVEFIDSKSYLSGFIQDLFDNKRPINTLEISHTYNAILTNAMDNGLIMGFIQVTDNKGV